jgi:hypothetical protein
MLIGIRPINDFAFKKTFGSPENKLALISLQELSARRRPLARLNEGPPRRPIYRS